MVDKRKKQRLEIDKSPFDTTNVPAGSSAVGVQPKGGLGIALVGLGLSRVAIPAISKQGQTLYGLVKNPSTGRLVVEKLSNIPQAAMGLVRYVIKSTSKKVPTVDQIKKGAKTNFKSTPKSKTPINNAQREIKEEVDNLINAKQISKKAGNSFKRLINKVPTPALLNFIKNPKAVAGVGAGVVGAGGLAAYIANLSSNKDEADAAMQLVNRNFPAYGDMIKGGREQAKIAAEEAKGIFRTRRVLDDATKEKIS